eukprot:s1102_g7.t1
MQQPMQRQTSVDQQDHSTKSCGIQRHPAQRGCRDAAMVSPSSIPRDPFKTDQSYDPRGICYHPMVGDAMLGAPP